MAYWAVRSGRSGVIHVMKSSMPDNPDRAAGAAEEDPVRSPRHSSQPGPGIAGELRGMRVPGEQALPLIQVESCGLPTPPSRPR